MSFELNATSTQEPKYTRNDANVMYTEIKTSNPDAGGIKCILDRTQEDVYRVKYLTRQILLGQATEEEYKEFQKPLKAALNYEDLDRIENNIGIIQEMFGLTLVSMDRDYIPRIPYFTNLLINVKIIRDTMYILSTTPEVPSLPVNTYQNWNDIEQILYDVYWMKRRFDRSFYYATSNGSELACGGNFLI